jgi:hypothetical protein
MSDVAFVLLTVACFGLLAVLVGLLDRFVVGPDSARHDR